MPSQNKTKTIDQEVPLLSTKMPANDLLHAFCLQLQNSRITTLQILMANDMLLPQQKT
jgi:hypothetical protein